MEYQGISIFLLSHHRFTLPWLPDNKYYRSPTYREILETEGRFHLLSQSGFPFSLFFYSFSMEKKYNKWKLKEIGGFSRGIPKLYCHVKFKDLLDSEDDVI